jgi:hypothetical protein
MISYLEYGVVLSKSWLNHIGYSLMWLVRNRELGSSKTRSIMVRLGIGINLISLIFLNLTIDMQTKVVVM